MQAGEISAGLIRCGVRSHIKSIALQNGDGWTPMASNFRWLFLMLDQIL